MNTIPDKIQDPFRDAPPLVLYIVDLIQAISECGEDQECGPAMYPGLQTALAMLACRMLGRPASPDELPDYGIDWATRYVDTWLTEHKAHSSR